MYEHPDLTEIMLEVEKSIKDKWNAEVEKIKDLIHPKYIAFAESHDTYESEGIVEIETMIGYNKKPICKIVGEAPWRYGELTFSYVESRDGESKYEGRPIKFWLWQTTGILGDDYSGWVLLPLKDGKRFWKVNYEC